MADSKLIGQDCTTPDLVANVSGKATSAEDFRVEGMLFARLLCSPMPHDTRTTDCADLAQ
jgi:xanthine dehydrogenase molybdenum-binding subunit